MGRLEGMQMKQILLIASLFTLISTQAFAGFFTNRQGWNDKDPALKKGYVMGAYDEMTTPWVTDKEDIVTQKRKISKCAVDMGLSDDSLVEIVDNYYTDLEQWSNPPNIALRVGLLKVCKMLQ